MSNPSRNCVIPDNTFGRPVTTRAAFAWVINNAAPDRDPLIGRTPEAFHLRFHDVIGRQCDLNQRGVSTNPSRICIAYRDTEIVRRRGRAAGPFAGTDFMPNAIEQIVDAYVRLKNRRGLDQLMMHRQRLAVDLKTRSGYDFSLPIGQIEEEIAIIEAGLRRIEAENSST